MKKFKPYLINNISLTTKSLSFPDVKFSLTQPKNDQFGDLSSNIPLLLAGKLNKNPLEIGELIVNDLKNKNLEEIININVTPPGFINFEISDKFFQKKINTIIREKENYGRGNKGIGKSDILDK